MTDRAVLKGSDGRARARFDQTKALKPFFSSKVSGFASDHLDVWADEQRDKSNDLLECFLLRVYVLCKHIWVSPKMMNINRTTI